MHDVAAYLVRRDHRLASEIRDLLETQLAGDSVLAGGSVPELEELTRASAGLDRATSANGDGTLRLGRLKIALDAALADWLGDTGRPVPDGTTATTGRHRAKAHEAAVSSGSGPASSTRQARTR